MHLTAGLAYQQTRMMKISCSLNVGKIPPVAQGRGLVRDKRVFKTLFTSDARLHKGCNRWQLVRAESPGSEKWDDGATAPRRDDDVLPDSLTDAIQESAAATLDAMGSGYGKCVVEIFLPDFWDPNSGPVYSEEGDQLRFWKMTRRFIDNIVTKGDYERVRAIYPDAGVAAMLKSQWTDATFSISSLNDRKPVDTEDQLVIMASPDPPSLDSIIKISNGMQDGQYLVMFNPRLASGDVGVGLNIRRLRDTFLSDFVTVYSLRPIGDVGSVFKRFPSQWQVFVADSEAPGRYILAAERPSRPGGEDLDLIVMRALGIERTEENNEEIGLPNQISMAFRSIQRFMNSLSR